MEIIEKAKETAIHLTELAKEKVDDLKDRRKAGELLDDLGRTVFLQRTGRGEAGDDAAIASIVAELQALEADGTPVVMAKDSAAPTTESGAAPPPESSPTTTAPTTTSPTTTSPTTTSPTTTAPTTTAPASSPTPASTPSPTDPTTAPDDDTGLPISD